MKFSAMARTDWFMLTELSLSVSPPLTLSLLFLTGLVARERLVGSTDTDTDTCVVWVQSGLYRLSSLLSPVQDLKVFLVIHSNYQKNLEIFCKFSLGIPLSLHCLAN